MSITIEQLRTELAPIKTQVDGIPLIHRSIEVLRQEVRALRAAFNDFALTNVTKGEIEALHHDVNATMTRNAELEHRIVTLERLVADRPSQ